jgi:hypothetical protein
MMGIRLKKKRANALRPAGKPTEALAIEISTTLFEDSRIIEPGSVIE